MRQSSLARSVFTQVAAASLVLFVTAIAHADSTITVTNHGGMTGTSAVGVLGPFYLTGSNATIEGSTTGSLSFVTGSTFTALTTTGLSGSTSMTNGTELGYWNSTGSTFVVRESTGIVFSGTFTGDVTWTFGGCNASNDCTYTLNGSIQGTYDGMTVTGATTQLTLTTTGGLYNGGKGATYIKDVLGSTYWNTSTVPEPGSLTLMGTGLLGAGFIVRRKIKANQG